MLSLHYLVKCRSRSLTVDNNEFILGNAHVSSKIINEILTNTTGNYYLSKGTHLTSNHLHYNMCSKCPLPARTQAVDIDTNLLID